MFRRPERKCHALEDFVLRQRRRHIGERKIGEGDVAATGAADDRQHGIARGGDTGQFGGRIETFPADTVVWVPIRQGQAELPSALEAAGAGFVVVGDALAGRNLQTAMREGHLAARALSLVTRS